jgi:hypothetical protein
MHAGSRMHRILAGCRARLTAWFLWMTRSNTICLLCTYRISEPLLGAHEHTR